MAAKEKQKIIKGAAKPPAPPAPPGRRVIMEDVRLIKSKKNKGGSEVKKLPVFLNFNRDNIIGFIEIKEDLLIKLIKLSEGGNLSNFSIEAAKLSGGDYEILAVSIITRIE